MGDKAIGLLGVKEAQDLVLGQLGVDEAQGYGMGTGIPEPLVGIDNLPGQPELPP
jgi:hypothetical protein